MSKTNFTTIIRCALWTSYNHTCFYCTQPLDWDDLHIDHIIPESYLDNPVKLEELLLYYGLPANFNINGFDNLVPTHQKCNLRKKDSLFPKQTTLFYIGLTSNKILQIESEVQKLLNKKKERTSSFKTSSSTRNKINPNGFN